MSASLYISETFNDVTLRERCWHIGWDRFRPAPHLSVSPSFALFRLLLGGVQLEFANGCLIQNTNYMAGGSVDKYTPYFYGKLKAAFPTLGIQNSAGDFLIYSAIPAIQKYLAEPGGNHGFFSSVFDEVSRSIAYLNINQGLSAFAHLYRAFETLSYSFPLYHARQNKTYLKAYDQLKRYFKGGELDFCSNFIREIINEDPLTSADTRRMSFLSPLSNQQIAYFADHHRSLSVLHPCDVEVNLADVFDFIVKLRNHYFHQLSGSNFSLDSRVVPRSDQFFVPPTEIGIGLIGIIFGKMIVNAI